MRLLLQDMRTHDNIRRSTKEISSPAQLMIAAGKFVVFIFGQNNANTGPWCKIR